MPIQSYSKKGLKFVITLKEKNFRDTDNNQIILTGFRATTNITNAGGQSFGTANYQNMPDVNLYIQALAGYINLLAPSEPRSFKGSFDVATVLEQIANSMGFVLENNGVAVTLSDVYLENTAMEQFKKLAAMAGIDVYMDKDVIAICPAGIPRRGLVAIISPQTGMVGYPTFDCQSTYFTTLFNPSIRYGGRIKVVSDLPQATGEWVVVSITNTLDSEKPNGNWFSQVRGLRGNVAVISR